MPITHSEADSSGDNKRETLRSPLQFFLTILALLYAAVIGLTSAQASNIGFKLGKSFEVIPGNGNISLTISCCISIPFLSSDVLVVAEQFLLMKARFLSHLFVTAMLSISLVFPSRCFAGQEGCIAKY